MTSTPKTQAEKDQHKRDRFKALFVQRVNALVMRHKQLLNLANQSNYKFTEDEAKQAVRLYELMLLLKLIFHLKLLNLIESTHHQLDLNSFLLIKFLIHQHQYAHS